MKRILILLSICFAVILLRAQSTTSSIAGQVADESNESLPGATVVALHEPSGTRYTTIVNAQGKYQIQGVRPGGPYRIEFSYVGFSKAIFTDIVLMLGDLYSCDVVLKPSTHLDDFVVVANASKFAGEKTGASNNISLREIQRFPNLNRGLMEVAKMSPYMNGLGIGGRDIRMSNFMVDGANFNNATGLGGVALPGGGNPISIDALEEVQINVAPFDVRLSNFIGGAVSAITKSGTNRFKASAYTYLKNETLRGNSVDEYDLGERKPESRTIYGLTVGGPIIKNKLFFFVNGEYTYSPFPIHKWKLSEDGKYDTRNMISRVTDGDMHRFSTDLMSMYGYDTGSWSDFSGKSEMYRAMARMDWNIADNHRFMLRYNYTGQQKDNPTTGAALDRSMSPPVGPYSMSFRNSTWQLVDNVHSFTAELNSRFGALINNQLLASVNLNDINNWTCNGDFPTVDIMKPDENGVLQPFMNAGYDQYAWRNGVKEKIWSVVDNFSMQLGAHNLMLGVSFESQNISNSYMRYGAGYYRYGSYDAFLNREAPVAFALAYSLTGAEKPLADVHYSQFSVYAQDEFNVNPRLNLFYGVRMDLPFYLNKRYENPSIAHYEFNGVKLSTGFWPKTQAQFSPRIGFNYDLLGDKSLKLRGGTGVFTGRFPLIFLSKMQEGSGMLTATVTAREGDPLLAALAGGIRTPDQVLSEVAPGFPDKFPKQSGAVTNIVTIDRDFKIPQAWKTSLAVDWHLPLPFRNELTLEAVYVKDINAILQRNVNIIAEDDSKMSRLSGPDNRYYYPGNKEMRIHQNINYAILMTNTHEGYSYNLNASWKMEPVRGLNLMAAYVYTQSKTLSNNLSNQVDGAWSQEQSVNGPNYLTLHNASYLASPHRIIASASYKVEYARNLATSLSVFYTGEQAGSYSYIVGNPNTKKLDLNNDGYFIDLMYIPTTKDELIFVDLQEGGKSFTAAEQRDAFWTFLEQDPYLSKHKGEYAQTGGAYRPWYHRIDIGLTQEFKLKVGKANHVLQLNVELFNFLNLLNNSWGITRSAVTNMPLTFNGLTEENVPKYTMTTIKEDGQTKLPYQTFVPDRNSGNCWQIQFGVRYIFN